MVEKKVVCIIQARMGSTRLPSKVLLDLAGKPMLLRVVDRVLQVKTINKVVVATTTERGDDKIIDLLAGYHSRVDIFRGLEDDVLDRYYRAAKKFEADIIVRITSDCPFIDPVVIDKVVKDFIESQADYTANIIGKRTYPRGLDVEVFSFRTLEKIWKKAVSSDDREHVTLYLRKNPEMFKSQNVVNDNDYSHLRLTVDKQEDYKLAQFIYKELFFQNPNFRLQDIIELFNKKPEFIKINQDVEQKLGQF